MSTLFNVKNRSAGVTGYSIPELGIRRSFAPGETKQISAVELEKLTYQPGGMAILGSFLQILDEVALQQVGLRPEPEYYMSEADVVKLITTGSLDAFLDCLDFAPSGVIDLIKSLSVKIPLTDIYKRQALKTKTGFDVDAALKHVMEEHEDDKPAAAATPQRRVQQPATQPGRRTSVPKYNVTKMGNTETASPTVTLQNTVSTNVSKIIPVED